MRAWVVASIVGMVGVHQSNAACLTPEQIDDCAIEIVLAETCGKRDQARIMETRASTCASDRVELAERLLVYRANALHTGCAGDMRSPVEEARPARSLSELLGR